MRQRRGDVRVPGRTQSSLFARVMVLALVACLGAAAAARADDPFPLGKRAVPADFRPMMQRPFGISFASMNLTETLDVSGLDVVLGGQPLPPGIVSASRLTQTTHVNSVRGDLWLFPFANVYAFAGKVTGTAKNLDVTVAPVPFLPPIQVPASFDYSGHTYGFGSTFAGGYRHGFASYDVNYSRSSVDLLSTTVRSITQAIRAGVVEEFGSTHVAVYGGAFYESIRSRLGGSGLLNVGGLQPDFSVSVKPRDAWDALAGTSVEITPHFTVTAEGGFFGRKQFLISPGVRF